MSEFEEFFKQLKFPTWFNAQVLAAIERYCKVSWDISREQSITPEEALLILRQKAYNTGDATLKKRMELFAELIKDEFDKTLL